MERILVTGGAGFIGANFVHYWLRKHPGYRLVALDALTYAGNQENLRGLSHREDFRFVKGDIRDGTLVECLLREECIDTIVHFAAESHVDRSIMTPDVFLETNVLGTHCLLKAAHKIWGERGFPRDHRFHHVSTDEVYGSLGPNDPPFQETTPYAPNSPYAASKAGSDHLVRAYQHTFGLPTTISHCSNNYGPYHFPEKLIPLTILNILKGRSLRVYGDGRHRRDWLHVDDHCRAIERILREGKPGEVYNIGGGAEIENVKLVESLCHIADELFSGVSALSERFAGCPAVRGTPCSSLIQFVPDRPGHDRRYATSFDKARRSLGYEPSVLLSGGLQKTFVWYVENDWWWRDARAAEISWA